MNLFFEDNNDYEFSTAVKTALHSQKEAEDIYSWSRKCTLSNISLQ
jgi:hypothetical protein